MEPARSCALLVFESEFSVVENRPSTREVTLMAIWAETPAVSVGAFEVDGGCRIKREKEQPPNRCVMSDRKKGE